MGFKNIFRKKTVAFSSDFPMMPYKAKKTMERTNYQAQLDAFVETVYNCVSINAKSVMALDIHLFTMKQKNGQKTKALTERQKKHFQLKYSEQAGEVKEIYDHPFLDLLYQVNNTQTSAHLKNLTVTFLELTGNCFWYIPSSGLGLPQEIWILPTQNLYKINKDESGTITGYEFRSGSQTKSYDPKEIMHIKYANPYDPYLGLSPLMGSAISVSREEKMNTYDDNMLDNQGLPDGYLKANISLNDTQIKQIRQAWKDKYSGVKNAGEIAVLGQDLDFVQLTLNPREMAFLTGRKWTREQIAGAFGVPVVMLSAEYSNRSIQEVAVDVQHAKYAIKPICTYIQESINEVLLPKYGEGLFCEFDDPVPEDNRFSLEKHTKLVASGIETIDEARIDLGLQPIGINYPLVPSSQMPVGQEQVEELVDKIIGRLRTNGHS